MSMDPRHPSHPVPKPEFGGRIPRLAGHAFDCRHPRHASTFATTDNEIQLYIRATYPHGHLVVESIRAGELREPPMPPEPAADASVVAKKIFDRRIDEYVKHTDALQSELLMAYSIYLGQCSDDMTRCLHAMKDFRTNDAASDVFWLRSAIRAAAYTFDETADEADTLGQALLSFYLFRQGRQMSDADYYAKYVALRDAVHEAGGSLGAHPKLIKRNIDRVTAMADEDLALHLQQAGIVADPSDAIKKIKEEAVPPATPSKKGLLPPESYEALQSSDSSNGTALVLELAMAMSEEHFCAAFFLRRADHDRHGQFVTHLRNSFDPERSRYDPITGEEYLSFLRVVDSPITLSQQHEAPLPREWTILDNGSTCHVTWDDSLLRNIRPATQNAVIHTNSGSTRVSTVGDIGPIQNVLHDPGSLATILSFAQLRNLANISYIDDVFVCDFPTGHRLRFAASPTGLYFCHSQDLRQVLDDVILATSVRTVANNAKGFTPRQIQQAAIARDAIRRMGFPSMKTLKNMVRHNTITNCPFSLFDLEASHEIFGPDVPSIKGKTTRRTPIPVPSQRVPVPSEIYRRSKDLILAADIMFVSGLAFLITVSKPIDLVTVEYMPAMTGPSLTKALSRVISMYQHKGFCVTTAMVDNQFRLVATSWEPLT